MSNAILACGSLVDYVMEAQRRMETAWPMTVLDRKYHRDPKEMRAHVIDAVNGMPSEVDTVLVGMGFCGGSWESVSFGRRVVIPRVDDCVTLLLHTDDAYCPDLKQKGHLYMKDRDPQQFSLRRIFDDYTEGSGPEAKELLFHRWFDSYTHVDVVDTGLYDCHTEEYQREARANADWIGATVEQVRGSMILLEKLVSGRWDEQFLVAEPGHVIRRQDFFDA